MSNQEAVIEALKGRGWLTPMRARTFARQFKDVGLRQVQNALTTLQAAKKVETKKTTDGKVYKLA